MRDVFIIVLVIEVLLGGIRNHRQETSIDALTKRISSLEQTK